MSELAILLSGTIILVLSIALFFTIGSRHRNSETDIPTLDQPIPPDQASVAMVGAAFQACSATRLFTITIIDLAARGYLHLREISLRSSRVHQWLVQRSDQPIDAGTAKLSGHERAIIEAIENSHTGQQAHAASLSHLLDDSQLIKHVNDLLGKEIEEHHWFAKDKKTRFSVWGLIGGLVLLSGLLLCAAMLIDWLASRDFRGVLGAVMIIASGALFTANGRQRRATTERGNMVETHTASFLNRLVHISLDDVDLSCPAEQFNRLLPWAIHLGNADQMGAVFDQARLERAIGEVDLPVPPPWYHPIDHVESLEKVAINLTDFYNTSCG